MKTKEFIEKVEELGYYVEIDWPTIYIKCDGCILARVDKARAYTIDTKAAFEVKNKEDIIDSIGDVYVTLVIGNMLKKQRELDPMFAKRNVLGSSNKESMLRVLANIIDLNLREPYEEQTILYTMKDLHIVCKFYDLDFTECVESAYNTIKNRHGKLIDGMYVKDEDL